MISLTNEEIKQLKNVLEKELDGCKENLRENSSPALEKMMIEPIEQTEKLITYLDSKIVKTTIGAR